MDRLVSRAAATAAVCAMVAGGEIVPQSRLAAWQPGIPGGIPTPAVALSVASHGAVADSVTDDFGAFRSAIDALPAQGGVVLVPEGTYRIDSSLVLGSGVVLRGEGAGRTRLLFAIADAAPCVDMITYGRGQWTPVVSGATHGSVRVKVGDASSFAAGGFAEIQQENDSALMYTDPEWIQSWGDNSVGQVVVVERVAGDTLVLRTPLYMNYNPALNPQVRSQRFVERAGVERLFLTRTVAAADGPTISLKNVAYCWVREVESDHTRKAHVTTNTAFACEFRDSYFHHAFDYGGSGHGYGVTLGFHTTDCLTENNIFRHLRHAMMVQVGASGNVFGYNYSLENVQGDGETNLNDGWTPCDISLHGHYPNYNLFEGNIVQEIDIADYWGPCGPGNTFLRNRVVSEGIEVFDQSHVQNLVGNVSGSGGSGITVEAGVESTLVHGNTVDGTVQWDAGIVDHGIPVSYYLDQAPSFWTTLPWPPLGSDVGDTGTIPAQVRFEQGMYVAPVVRAPRSSGQRGGAAAVPVQRVWFTLSGRAEGRAVRVSNEGASAGVRVTGQGTLVNVVRQPGVSK